MPVKLKPFDKIGLCFSGGGYRATFYGLGVLSVLHKIQFQEKSLLEAVKSISSVSGGTLLAAAYTRSVQKNQHFNDFYQKLYTTFEPANDQLLENATRKLKDDQVWKKNTYKRRSVINAFALCYQEMEVFEGTFEMFHKNHIKQFDTVCFNATDFTYGLTYRFQNRGDFGNGPLYKSYRSQINALKDQIEIGDIVASSSCFPIGFAPLVFPDDYIKDHNNSSYQQLKSYEVFKDGVGLMDGGIADNQGIGSMVLADKRKGGRLDLILINDVGGNQMPAWEPSHESESVAGISLTDAVSKVLDYLKVRALYWIPGVIAVLMLILNDMQVFGDRSYASIYIVFGVLLGASILATTIGLIASVVKNTYLKKIAELFEKNVPKPIEDDILRLKNLKVSLIKRMLAERMSSAFTMINYVFMNQIRRLNYDLLYSSSKLKNRRATAMIYELDGQRNSYTRNDEDKVAIDPPSKLLQDVALTATQMPTTLWWSEEDIKLNRMNKLIACGQFTVCYKLLKYIIELQDGTEDRSEIDEMFGKMAIESLEELPFPELIPLEQQLRELWRKFNENPLWMVEE